MKKSIILVIILTMLTGCFACNSNKTKTYSVSITINSPVNIRELTITLSSGSNYTLEGNVLTTELTLDNTEIISITYKDCLPTTIFINKEDCEDYAYSTTIDYQLQATCLITVTFRRTISSKLRFYIDDTIISANKDSSERYTLMYITDYDTIDRMRKLTITATDVEYEYSFHMTSGYNTCLFQILNS